MRFLALTALTFLVALAVTAGATAIPFPPVNMDPSGGGCTPGDVMYLYNGHGYTIFYCVVAPPPMWMPVGTT